MLSKEKFDEEIQKMKEKKEEYLTKINQFSEGREERVRIKNEKEEKCKLIRLEYISPSNVEYLQKIYEFCFEKSEHLSLMLDISTFMCSIVYDPSNESYVSIKEHNDIYDEGRNPFKFIYKKCTCFKMCYEFLIEEFSEFKNSIDFSKYPHLKDL